MRKNNTIMSWKQRLFVEDCMCNTTEAVLAGYSPKSKKHTGHHLIKLDYVQVPIKKMFYS